jgi:hypothetical protein
MSCFLHGWWLSNPGTAAKGMMEAALFYAYLAPVFNCLSLTGVDILNFH